MKRFTILFLILILILTGLVILLTACSETTSGSGGSYGSGSSSSSSNSSNSNGSTSSAAKCVSITTKTHLTKQKDGVQLSTDKFYVGENIFLRVILTAENKGDEVQSVGLTITIDNAQYIDVYNEETGNTKPLITRTSTLAGGSVVTISQIQFNINAKDTKTREFVFKLSPENECSEGYITVQYIGNVDDDDSAHNQAYKFEKRTNLDIISTPIIAPNNDGFNWTESPVVDIDKKLYTIQIFQIGDDKDTLVHSYDDKTQNYFKLSDLSNELEPGNYRIVVTTKGDNVSTQNSSPAAYEFTFVEPISEVKFENGIISWEKVENATKYLVEIGDFSEYVTENQFNVAEKYDGAAGNLQVTVLPIISGKNLTTKTIPIEIEVFGRLNVTVSGAYATWNEIEGAVYHIYINGEYKGTVTEAKYRKVQGKELYLTVVAMTENGVSICSNRVDISTD